MHTELREQRQHEREPDSERHHRERDDENESGNQDELEDEESGYTRSRMCSPRPRSIR